MKKHDTKSLKFIHKTHLKFLYWNIYLVTLVGIIYFNYRKTQENYNSFKVADDKNMWLQTRILIWKYIPNKYDNDAMTPSVIMNSGTNLFKQVHPCSSYSTCYFWILIDHIPSCPYSTRVHGIYLATNLIGQSRL